MDRERALRVHVQRYAHRLQEYCLSNPYQWFNFYDFWSAGILARDIAPHAKQPAAEAHAHEQ
jgi:predicted LPLAT superfamily acyltransferase